MAISAIVLLASCKKSNNNTENPPVKKLKYLTRSTIVQGATTRFIDYTYDDKNRVSTAKIGTTTTTYTYNGNNLFSIEAVDQSAGYRKTTEHTYNNDGSVSSTHDLVYRNNVLSSDIVYNYLIVNGRITEIHFEIYVSKRTYDDKGNLINSYSGSGNYNTVGTYDDKPNIYTNGFPNPNGLYFSPNNLVTSSDDFKNNLSYTYTYDTDGYPTGAVESAPSAVTTKYAYTYTEM